MHVKSFSNQNILVPLSCLDVWQASKSGKWWNVNENKSGGRFYQKEKPPVIFGWFYLALG